MKPAWHALFAPLPAHAVVKRKPVGSGEAIAGWQSLTVELSAGPAGLRHVMVTLDASGTPISAGDWVMYATEGADGTTYIHENVGGRLEADGTFMRESRHSPPSPEDVEAIRNLVREVLAR